MTHSMLLGATPIPPNSADCLSSACSPAVAGEQARFEQSLAQVASNQGSAVPPADRLAAAPPMLEVQRTNVLASPPGDRILQTLSSIYQGRTVPPPIASAAVTGVQPGPAAQPLLQADNAGAHAAVKPVGTDFESMMTNLRDVYRDVIQVSLVSKGTSAVSSSLNKLLSAG
ncbi:nodulation protein NolB [Bradyrhizobium sp. CCBAU 51745]|uniref:nodulation protein NolB n=1 Tax=Bradyrhizobium sp. CCBAU 51745 TaxID=1325099 RepID=UPI000D3EE8D6|nr:nodulation protein B [Bradyrhizobium sp.]AVZ43703.1 nodulation protein B [Bradyrhizobium sp.]AVZ43706.1 nodulation protein B [Bradyrhizobium sp.]AVZ43712.1 nodulation protein B [Bradyrhizobium sp.]AVZ43718.1 nodulation protein B [Bradyrhizobium sp.]